jgi:hypothetical protein
MTCRLCETSGVHVAPNDRRCGFDSHGRFRPENLHCASLAALQGLATFKTSTDGGLQTATLGYSGSMIVLAWYGGGSRVAFAQVLQPIGEDAIRPGVLTLDVAEALIDSKTRRAG